MREKKFGNRGNNKKGSGYNGKDNEKKEEKA